MSDTPALVKPVFDHAIQNQGEPLRLFNKFSASLQTLENQFNDALELSSSAVRMKVYPEAGDLEFILLLEMQPGDDDSEELLKISVHNDRKRDNFVMHVDLNPEERLIRGKSSLEIEEYPTTEAGIQKLSVDFTSYLLKDFPVNAWKIYMDYLDDQSGQRAFNFD